ncbi:hypothetical protein [Aureispira anguillae]|uniref:Uncharacterized protein n=1 Tax=Aureispira anguillae TaxID=2864201 RepID=A0A915YGS3_9BACT|nr:hypothetical protein [Aureispira anguillae]BDS12721.1 hypothetical protein AsAng_0034460 [Aureispira anguillae]
MLKETNCPREDRILPIIGTIPVSLLPKKEEIGARLGSETDFNQDLLHKYYNWTLTGNEIIVYTGYGYCDVEIPKTYTYLICFDEQTKSLDVLATVKFAIWNGRIPLNMIESGHHTFCIIEFENGIPDILKELPNWDDIQQGNYKYYKFGLCEKEDVDLILEKIANME